MPVFTDTHCHAHDRTAYAFVCKRATGKSPGEAEITRLKADFSFTKILSRAADASVYRLILVGTDQDDSLHAAECARSAWACPVTAGRPSSDAHPAGTTSQPNSDTPSAGTADQPDVAPTADFTTRSRPATTASRSRTAAANRPRTAAFWSYGIHPGEHRHARSADLEIIRRLDPSAQRLLVAIGEIGLDYHAGTGDRSAQIRLLEKMLALAARLNLPLIFHVREAFPDFFAVLDNFTGAKIRGVVHSFSDSPANLQKSLERDFFIGVNGLATFTEIPLPPPERLLLETDAPFLTPVPRRGRVNEPALIPVIAACVADRLGVGLAELAEIIEQNAENLFAFSAHRPE